MGYTVQFALLSEGGRELKQVQLSRTIIAGWTGRNAAAMEAHIAELEELGVTRPVRTPMFYRVASRRITTAPEIEAIGSASSGEVEFFLIRIDGEIWVGVGSDHTDREAETHGVTLSKQMCDKPVAAELWRWADVQDHWSDLQLSSSIIDAGGERVRYQEGPVTAMLAPEDLLERFAKEDSQGGLGEGDLMMCGTLPAIGGVRGAQTFEFELTDKVLSRTIGHSYGITELSVEG